MRLLTRSPYGIMVKSIKENETRVKFLGYNTARYKWVTFVIASTMAGVAGSLFALVQGFVSPGVISTFSNIEVIFAILIGGAGLLYGAVVGGIVFMLIKNYLPMLIIRVDDITAFRLPQWEMWLGIILLIIVFSFRKGIAGFLKEKSYLLERLVKNKRESEEKNV
jgi:branched-chain amino acid transport system permease protein